MDETPDTCEECGSGMIAYILYGLPEFGDELVRSLDAGEVVLGGCTVFEGLPLWHCVSCGHRWGELSMPESEPHEP